MEQAKDTGVDLMLGVFDLSKFKTRNADLGFITFLVRLPLPPYLVASGLSIHRYFQWLMREVRIHHQAAAAFLYSAASRSEKLMLLA